MITYYTLTKDRLPALQAELRRDGNGDSNMRRISRRLSHSIEVYKDNEIKRICCHKKKMNRFLRLAEKIHTAIERIRNAAEKIEYINNAVYDSFQPDPKMFNDLQELHDKINGGVPPILNQLENIHLKNQKLEELQESSAYLRIRRNQYSSLFHQISVVIVKHQQEQIAYRQKCDSRAFNQCNIITNATEKLGYCISREDIVSLLLRNSTTDVKNREKVNESFFARAALFDLELKTSEARRSRISLQYLSDPFKEVLELMVRNTWLGNDNMTDSIQYQVDNVNNYIPLPKKQNQYLSKYSKNVSSFFTSNKNCFILSLLIFIIVFIILEFFKLLE